MKIVRTAHALLREASQVEQLFIAIDGAPVDFELPRPCVYPVFNPNNHLHTRTPHHIATLIRERTGRPDLNVVIVLTNGRRVTIDEYAAAAEEPGKCSLDDLLKEGGFGRHSLPRIICAAGTINFFRPDGSQTTVVVAGARHHDGVMNPVIEELAGYDADRIIGRVSQGFIDQHGFFYDRKSAWYIAHVNDQIASRHGGDGLEGVGLFSENLY